MNPGERAVNNRPPIGLSQALSRWTIRFSGGRKDLSIDEFFFRVEHLAAADEITANSIVLGLHCLLSDNASDFYWVQRRKFPDATYAQLKHSMVAHFLRQDSDFELRKFIMSRRQGSREEFGDFCLNIECMSARLTRQMDEAELLEILRQNMSPRLQDRLLLVPIQTIEQLKRACQKYERMWSSVAEQSKDRNYTGRLAELGFDSQTEPFVGTSNSEVLSYPAEMMSQLDINRQHELAEINRNRSRPNSDLVICWNCDDIGHTFVDCQSNERKIFCYGCGAKNVYKPKCPKCNSGNAKWGGAAPGRFRQNPFSGQPSRPNTNPR